MSPPERFQYNFTAGPVKSSLNIWYPADDSSTGSDYKESGRSGVRSGLRKASRYAASVARGGDDDDRALAYGDLPSPSRRSRTTDGSQNYLPPPPPRLEFGGSQSRRAIGHDYAASEAGGGRHKPPYPDSRPSRAQNLSNSYQPPPNFPGNFQMQQQQQPQSYPAPYPPPPPQSQFGGNQPGYPNQQNSGYPPHLQMPQYAPPPPPPPNYDLSYDLNLSPPFQQGGSRAMSTTESWVASTESYRSRRSGRSHSDDKDGPTDHKGRHLTVGERKSGSKYMERKPASKSEASSSLSSSHKRRSSKKKSVRW